MNSINNGWNGTRLTKMPLFSFWFEKYDFENQAISELCTNNNKLKYSSNLKDIFKPTKKNETL